MKASQKDFASVAPRAAGQAKVFFFCGPDEAGAGEAAREIVRLLGDAGERVEFTGAELRRDPVLLGDEARSTSLFGDSRHIWVRAAGDEAHDAVANLLAGEAEPCPVLIVATGASDKSRTAKLLADRPDALVAMFYPPEPKAVAASVRKAAAGLGLTMGSELAERIAGACGYDIRLAHSELEKLALYCDANPQRPRSVDAEALDAIGARTEDDGFAPLVRAVFGGHVGALASELRRMRELGINPVGLLLACERRAAQLAQLAARMGPRGNVKAFIEAESGARRIFWKDAKELGEQLQCWRGGALERLVERLATLHRELLTNSQGAELLLAQALAEITRKAASCP